MAPLTVTEADPFVPPLQATFVCDVPTVKAAGCVIVTVFWIEHVMLSVIVTVYTPATSPVAVAPVPPDGDQE